MSYFPSIIIHPSIFKVNITSSKGGPRKVRDIKISKGRELVRED